METPKGSPIKYHNGATLGSVAATGEGAALYFPVYDSEALPDADDLGVGACIVSWDAEEETATILYSDGTNWVSVSGATGAQGPQGIPG
jgi:hypothetical protein